MHGVLAMLAALGARGAFAAQVEGSIAGQVVDGATGRPVAAAVVSLSGSSLLGVPAAAQPPKMLTGADGRFVFRNLSPGVFSVVASKGGYAEGEPGRRRPGGSAPPIVIDDEKRAIEVTVPIWRSSAIAGVVLDEAGEPAVNLPVRALKRAEGGRAYSVAQTTVTDDRGAYRFGSLLPGEYIIATAPPPFSAAADVFLGLDRNGSRGEGFVTFYGERRQSPPVSIGAALLAGGPVAARVRLYPPTFYPAAPSLAQARAIVIGAGEERASADISIAPAPAARVSGLLLDDGDPAPKVTLRLVPDGTAGLPPDVVAPMSLTDAAGRFTFAGVVPGRYTLRGSTRSPGAWVDMPLSVGDGDIDTLVVAMQPPLRISAHTQYEGATPAPHLNARGVVQVFFRLDPVEGSMTNSLSIEGSFDAEHVSFAGVPPGRYRVVAADGPPGWMLKGAMLDGVDVSETPFDFRKNITDLTLVFTDQLSAVSGRVDGPGADGAAVLLFPADTQAWIDGWPGSRRFRSARTGTRGQFVMVAVPPGEYYIVAVPDEQSGGWREPAVLDSLARIATPIAVREGGMPEVALPMSTVR